MTKKIPTPETDAVAWVVAFGYQHLNEDVEVVDAEFARQLERERDKAHSKIEKLLTIDSRLFGCGQSSDSADNLRTQIEVGAVKTKLKEAKELMNDAMWQLMTFLKPADTKTQNIINALYHATNSMDNHTGR